MTVESPLLLSKGPHFLGVGRVTILLVKRSRIWWEGFFFLIIFLAVAVPVSFFYLDLYAPMRKGCRSVLLHVGQQRANPEDMLLGLV